ncbi:hypothetical protein RCL1_008932 [Eukaryota sp. TZLM3-RCL]
MPPPPSKKRRFHEPAEVTSSKTNLPVTAPHSMFCSSSFHSPITLSSTLLGLCLYQCMTRRIDSLQQFVSKKNKDLNKICLFLSKYATISVNFRKSVLNSISYWIRNNQSTLDLRAYIAKKGSLISRLNFNSAPATVSIQLTTKQLIMYLNGSRALKNLEKVLNPEFVVSVNLSNTCNDVYKGISNHFPFPNLECLEISHSNCWKKVLDSLEIFSIPKLRRVRLQIEHSYWSTAEDTLTFPSSFANICELQMIVVGVKFVLNIENLVNLTSFILDASPREQVVIGLSRLVHLKTLATPCINLFDKDLNPLVSVLHHPYDSSLLLPSVASNLIELELDNPNPIYHDNAVDLDFSFFSKLRRLVLKSFRLASLNLTPIPHLLELDLSYCRFTNIIFTTSSLTSFVCSGLYGLRSESACNLVGFNNLLFLSKLHVSGKIDHSLDSLACLPLLTDIKSPLDFFQSKSDTTMNCLRNLKMSRDRWDELDNFEVLEFALFLPKLKVLELDSTSVNFLNLILPERLPVLKELTLKFLESPKWLENSEPFNSVKVLNIHSCKRLGQLNFLSKFPNVINLAVHSHTLPITQVSCFLNCPKLVFLDVSSIRKQINSLVELSQLTRLEFLSLQFNRQVPIENVPGKVSELKQLMPDTFIALKYPRSKNSESTERKEGE